MERIDGKTWRSDNGDEVMARGLTVVVEFGEKTKAELLCAVKAVREENDRLRELVKAFDWCTENFDLPCKCDRCPLEQSDKLTPECEVRMRELRIEAD